jgi:hypothetical protein
MRMSSGGRQGKRKGTLVRLAEQHIAGGLPGVRARKQGLGDPGLGQIRRLEVDVEVLLDVVAISAHPSNVEHGMGAETGPTFLRR